ncbi:mycofactocin biosynthesis glycosyltransferase MftF [Prauserella oleivorans]|uniref:Mycofactocin biosynthesis glycosyltransferase MftF n=1 Tax=Prauserella oleivorans TaxID=1478153 RepID=A0ABW5W8I3_9PSEU
MKPGTRFVLDASVRRRGALLIGGSPLRLVRLGAAGSRLLARWLDGEALSDSPGELRLARKLVDAGLVHPQPPPGPKPADVTLVVPVKDNAEGVRRLVEATPEVGARIVVDDGSRESPPGASVRHPHPLGPAAARNAGWRRAETDLVAFLDADTVPEPGWLDALLPHFGDPAVVAVAPRVRSAARPGSVGAYERTRSALDLGARPAPVRPMSRVSYVPSAALVVRRSALSAVDGFDPDLRFGEDVDLVWRLLEIGAVRYEPAAVVVHEPRATVRSWLRQRFDYGTSAAPLSARHPGRLGPARLSAWVALAWVLLAAGRPLAGAVLAAGGAASLTRRLRDIPAAESLRLAARGQLGGGRLLTEAVRRAWWPLLLPTRRGRRVLAAAFAPCAVRALGRPPAWLALRILDDLAYCAGVWAGCVRHRTAAPLLPRFTEATPR